MVIPGSQKKGIRLDKAGVEKAIDVLKEALTEL